MTDPVSHYLPARLPGLDIEVALARLGNDTELYLDLIEDYREMLKDFACQFRGFAAGLDAEGARRGAHSLKGAAGTMGALILQGSAKALEQACKQGDLGQALALLPQVENDIAEVLDSLARICRIHEITD